MSRTACQRELNSDPNRNETLMGKRPAPSSVLIAQRLFGGPGGALELPVSISFVTEVARPRPNPYCMD